MSETSPSVPIANTKWYALLTLGLLAVGTFFQAKGPLDASYFATWPHWLVVTVQFLLAHALISSVVLILLIVRLRWKSVRPVYVALLRKMLGPVIEQHERTFATKAELDQTRKEKAPIPKRGLAYGDRILVRHQTTGTFLHSLSDRTYSHKGGSDQQMVFTVALPDENSVWILVPRNGIKLQEVRGKPIDLDEPLRFLHEGSNFYLHSHAHVPPSQAESDKLPEEEERKKLEDNPFFPKPVGKAVPLREVCASHNHDEQDDWRLLVKAPLAPRKKLRILHESGKRHLHSYARDLFVKDRARCLEVACREGKTENDLWLIDLVPTGAFSHQ